MILGENAKSRNLEKGLNKLKIIFIYKYLFAEMPIVKTDEVEAVVEVKDVVVKIPGHTHGRLWH